MLKRADPVKICGMYEGWHIERWETPASAADSVVMVSLVDMPGSADARHELAITLDIKTLGHWHRYRVVFGRCPAYRNIMEEFRLELWAHRDETAQLCGWTFVVIDSPWVASFRPAEPLLDVYFPALTHYVITTENDVIEVLTPDPPRIEDLGLTPSEPDPTSVNAPGDRRTA
jgi:hypothetical protein